MCFYLLWFLFKCIYCICVLYIYFLYCVCSVKMDLVSFILCYSLIFLWCKTMQVYYLLSSDPDVQPRVIAALLVHRERSNSWLNFILTQHLAVFPVRTGCVRWFSQAAETRVWKLCYRMWRVFQHLMCLKCVPWFLTLTGGHRIS